MKERINEVLFLEKTKKVWRKNRDSKEFKLANSLNYHFFGTHLKTGKCSCIEDLFYFLNNISDEIINQKNKKNMSKFKLKEGVLIALHNISHQVTNDNLTDEIALDILTKYPAHKVSFAVLPDNIDELIDQNKKKSTKEIKKELETGLDGLFDYDTLTLDELKEKAAGYPIEGQPEKPTRASIIKFLKAQK